MTSKYSKFIASFLLFFALAVSNSFADDMKECQIQTNLHCGSCKTKITNGLKKIDGIQKYDVNLDNKVVTISYNAAKINEDKLVQTIANLGYTASAIHADNVSEGDCSTKKVSNTGDASCKEAKECKDKKVGSEDCCPSKMKKTNNTKVTQAPEVK